MTITRVVRDLKYAAEDAEKTINDLADKVDAMEIENQGLARQLTDVEDERDTLQAEVTRLEDSLAKTVACIMPHCPNPRYTESGHCHYHRYLRGDAAR